MSYPQPQVQDWSEGGLITVPPTSIDGLSVADTVVLRRLVTQWQCKRARNAIKTAYWTGKHRLEHVGFSIPPAMKELEEVVGWPAKAVQAHAERCMFDGFVSDEDSVDPFGLRRILTENRFDVELPQAITSAMIHSCAFVSVEYGDRQAGEPEILVMPHSAQWATGLWNPRTRALDAALIVNDIDDYGRARRITFYDAEKYVIFDTDGVGNWKVHKSILHGLKRTPVEVLAYRPTLDCPFGKSVISRAVMSITDDAVRTVLRCETSAEFYSSPQLMLMGADPESFTDDDGNPIPMWEFIIGRINILSKDADGDVPTLQQISAQSVQPHIEQMRELACRFSGETNVPVHSLGVVTDNPSSAQAMHAAEKDLVVDCAAATRTFGAALRRVGQDIVMLRDQISELDDELASLSVRWRNPAMPSVIDSGDAMVKLISAFPWLADTTVALEEVGFTDEQIARLISEKRKAEAKNTLQTLLGVGKAVDDGGQAGRQPIGDGTEQHSRAGQDELGETVGTDTEQ